MKGLSDGRTEGGGGAIERKASSSLKGIGSIINIDRLSFWSHKRQYAVVAHCKDKKDAKLLADKTSPFHLGCASVVRSESKLNRKK